MRIVEAEWESFRHAVKIEQASPLQTREMRRAFYAGATYLMNELATNISPGSEPTEGDFLRVQSVMEELTQFKDRVGRGEA